MENTATIYGKTTETASIMVSITIYSYAFVYWRTGVSKLIYNSRGTVSSVSIVRLVWLVKQIFTKTPKYYPLATEGF